ncbi:MAG: hypothetical protein P1P85_03100 [Patescibacteria group bacterium]|nr:hypothetical protein [Patescibacteria group bacterium]
MEKSQIEIINNNFLSALSSSSNKKWREIMNYNEMISILILIYCKKETDN